MICRICNKPTKFTPFIVREMMYGLRDEFLYFECSSCGCVQISEYPDNMTKYYPKDYYSYANNESKNESFLIRYLRKQRARQLIFNKKNILGFLMGYFLRPPLMFELLKVCGAKPESRILEIGFGAGSFLIKLQKLGFKNLKGLDPFLDQDIMNHRMIIRKLNIYEIEGQYDLIIAKDVIEHMPQQYNVFDRIKMLLSPNGAALISLPIIGYAYKHYGANWAALDAPRHFYLHTLNSLRFLCDQANLEILLVRFDSSEGQFICSEQYLRNIPLIDNKSYFQGRDGGLFSVEDIEIFKKKTFELNQNQEGDHVSICLRRKIIDK